MKKVGNVASNKSYNPQSKKPPVPIDADEADSAMERFIRKKYINNGLVPARRYNTGSTESDETPPPLPPKPASRFGFRSPSSIFPLGSKAKKEAAAREPQSPRDMSQFSPRRSKPSQIFGATVHYDEGNDTENKLAKLRSMGFSDDQRNSLVLKGVNGDLEQTIDALVRLGEGPPRPVRSSTAPLEISLSANRTLTPAKSASFGPDRASSNNPFDMLDTPPAQPQSSQSTGTLPNKNPYLNTNPFGMPAQQASATLDWAFQNMSLAPSQPLFPHHTGGIPTPPQQPQEIQAMYQQPTTYPIQSHVQQPNNPSVLFNNNQASTPPLQSAYNPFFANQQAQQSLTVNTAVLPGGFGNNPFTRSPTRIQSPLLTQIPEQSQQNFYSSAAQQQQPQQQMNNPFFEQAMYAPQQAAQLSPRPDKASIMALYNYPQLSSNPFQVQPQEQNPAQATGLDQMLGYQNVAHMQQQQQQQQYQQQQHQQYLQQQQHPQPQPQQPALLSPPHGNKNPFFSNGSVTAESAAVNPSLIDLTSGKHNVSRDSILAHGLEWSNGRHSPDAFASLSARDMR